MDSWAQRLSELGGDRLAGLLGVEVVDARDELVVAQFTVTPAHLTRPGFVYAAAIVGLADIACGYGVLPHLPRGASFTTVELKANFIGTARLGERVVARATPVHLGPSTQVWDATVENESAGGETIALFRCTQLVLRRATDPEPDGAR